MKVEVKYFCSNCDIAAQPLLCDVNELQDRIPDGWASVIVRLDIPRAPSEQEQMLGHMVEQVSNRTGISFGFIPGLMQPNPPKFTTELVLCSKCQEGPVFLAAMKEVETA